MLISPYASSSQRLYDKISQATNTPASALGTPTVASRDSATVTLSVEARAIQALLQNKPDEVNANSAAGFNDFLARFGEQIHAQGKAAPMLAELPESADPARLALAHQAVNFVLSKVGQPSAYAEQSSQNPFAELGRKSLSRIAFDDSGTFTSAERSAAHQEIQAREEDFTKAVKAQQESLTRRDKSYSAFWQQLTQTQAQATQLAEMTETERAWRGWGTLESVQRDLARLKQESPLAVPAAPEYRHLRSPANSVLAAVSEGQGSARWKMVSIQELAADNVRLTLIDFAPTPVDSSATTPTSHRTAESGKAQQAQVKNWLALYANVSRY